MLLTWIYLLLLLAPLALAAAIAWLFVGRLRRRWRPEQSRRLLAGLALRLGALALALVLVEGGVVAGMILVPPAELLVMLMRKGLPLADAKRRATALGFEWRVDEAALAAVPDSPGQDPDRHRRVICHTTLKDNRRVCENDDRAEASGVFFASLTCHLLVKNGAVDEWWFYMD
jgi:hypothetical protein